MDEKKLTQYSQQEEIDIIQSKIYLIRNQRVMLDRDLAELYQVETKQLTRQVRRNIERFPEDFMFELCKEENDFLRCQFGTLKGKGKFSKYLPLAFTEQGIAMLSGLLRSPIAIQMNINIMRAFVAMRQTLSALAQNNLQIEQLQHRIDNLDHYVNDILRDQNDTNQMQENLNQEINMQLDLLNISLAELKSEIKSHNTDENKPIGFKI